MTDHEHIILRNSIVAFIGVVSKAVIVVDHLAQNKVTTSAEKFLEYFDKALEKRLEQPDGAELETTMRKFRDFLGQSVRRGKSSIELGRAVDDIFDETDTNLDI